MKKRINIKSIICFIIPFAILLITLLIFYPGIVSYDGNNQWQQVQNKIITNSHPFFSTYFMYLLSKIYNSVTTIMIFQILLFSFIWWYFCNSIKTKNKKENVIKIILSMILCLVPLIGIYNITLWKDIIYTDYLFLVAVILYRWVNNKYSFSIPKYLFLGLILALVFSYRHNGIIVSILILVIFYIICFLKYIKKQIIKKELLKSIMTLLMFLLIIFIISIPKTEYLNKSNRLLKKENDVSYSSIDGYILWMTGAHLTDNNIKNKKDLQFLNNIIPIKEWNFVYNAYLINDTGNTQNLNKKYIVIHNTKFRKIFIKYSVKYPMTIIKHYLKADALLINPISSINGYVYTYCFPEMEYLPKYTVIHSKFPKLKKIYNKVIGISLRKPFIIFYEPAFILYLTLIMAIILSKKVYGKKIWIFILPMLMNTISLLPINLAQDLRYVYINYLTFFGVLLLFILNINSIFKKNKT